MKKNYILVVEDELNLAKSIAEYLEIEDYNVKVAIDGLEALSVIKASIPKLIVCDISMPRMDGYEFLKVIRSTSNLKHIPLLFLTAFNEKKDQRVAMELGADDFISKPFQFEELVSAIEARLKRHKEIAHNIPPDNSLDADQHNALAKLKYLSANERKILRMIAEGNKSSDIAEKIFISPKTVENHRYAITKKLGLKGQGVLLKFVLKVKNQL
jgi:DNA-binding NarL/FixJ family response regulator